MKVFLRQVGALVRLSFLELWRRNDVLGLAILAVAVMVPLACANPFGASGASRYLDEMALLLVWAFSLFVSLGTASRLFPPEFEGRTVYPLFAKPVSRGRVLLGKYLGAVCASWSALVVFYALFAGAVVLRGGSVAHLELAQAFVLHLGFAALAVAAALFGSLVVTRSANLTLVGIVFVAMFFFGRKLPAYAESASGVAAWAVRAAYAILPHVEFFDMRQRVIHGWGAVDGAVFLAVLLYGAIYVAILLGLSAVVLGRKRI